MYIKMDKYVKVLSVESGEITSTDNLRNFRIPEGDIYSLKDSYVNFNCRIDVTETAANAAGGSGVYLPGVFWIPGVGGKNPHFDNISFVRNASIKSGKHGVLESVRRVDVLKQNMGIPSQSVGAVLDKSYININQLVSPINSQQYSPFVSMNKEGGVKSVYNRTVPISIKLSDIYDFCDTDEYDTTRGGELSVHLELNRDKLIVNQLMKTNEIFPIGFTLFLDLVASDNVGNSITVGAVVGAVETPRKVTDISHSPYYVGQKLLINATAEGGCDVVPVDTPAVISSIIWTKSTGNFTLTFEENWGGEITGAQKYTTISAKVALYDNAILSITESELVLKRLVDSDVKGYDSINYTTFTCEEGSGNPTSKNFQNLFTIEPSANQAYMCFANGADDLISSTKVNDFRCTLNNIDVTDRDVLVKSPLYYDRLAQSLRGMGRSFNNATLNSGVTNFSTVGWSDVFLQAVSDSLPVVASLFSTDSNKYLQVNANTLNAPGISKYQLFKSIPRVFNY